MSLSCTSLDFPFFPLQTTDDKHTPISTTTFNRAQTPLSPFSFPSSPSTSGGQLDPFDLSVFDDPAYPFDFGATTPSSVALISPKSSFSVPAAAPPPAAVPFDIEALSTHHLQRYLHYQALVEATANDTANFEALFGSMQEDKNNSHVPLPVYSVPAIDTQGVNNMLSFQPQIPHVGQYYGAQPAQNWGTPFGYQMPNVPVQFAPQPLQQPQRPVAVPQYYIPTQRSSFEASTQAQSFWSRQSGSTSQTVASPPFPSTPLYSNLPLNNTLQSTSAPAVTTPADTRHAPRKASPAEREIDMEEEAEEGEDELSDYHGDVEGQDTKPVIPSMQVANLSGGGRGYVPGKTPDDPKKRHKCKICGRGFARAFNLKSHIQTHNPLRPKPHQCPHPSCKRGFSRLHDLERHRQGIHADGPLVDAKRIGVPPSIVRAHSRAESPRLNK